MRFAVSIQHIFLMSVGWLYVVVIVNAVGGGTSQAESLIRMSMIAGGIATILQSNRGIVGSGYFCPLSGSLTFLQPSILAVSTGGLSVLFGLVAVAGAFIAFLSRIAARLRVFFPSEVTGLMVAMSGLQYFRDLLESTTAAYVEGVSMEEAKKRLSVFLTAKYADKFDHFPQNVAGDVAKAYQVINPSR
jgi:NCS2 family nucleobase:cation symporter-2